MIRNFVVTSTFFTVFFLVSCQSSSSTPVTSTQNVLPKATYLSTPNTQFTFTPAPSAIFWVIEITPVITSTPVVVNVNTEKELNFVIRNQIYPYPCFGYNFAKAPLTDVNHASMLYFVEVNTQFDSKEYMVEEIADNQDGSRRAWVACNNANHCEDKIYVQDSESAQVYEITWEDQMFWRPIQGITWINTDILTLLQSANPDHALVMAIDVAKREVLYEGVIFPDYTCTTPNP